MISILSILTCVQNAELALMYALQKLLAREPLPEDNTSIADYVWLPLRFDGEMVYIDWEEEWSLDDYE